MTILEVLIGLPASGKSTYAKERENEGAVVLSSDRIRKKFNITTYTNKDNEKVFSILHERLYKELSKEYNTVIYDATNLSKKRIATLQQIRNKFKDVFIKYVFFKADIPTCVARDFLRKEYVGFDVIVKLLKSFTGFYEDQRLNLFDIFIVKNNLDENIITEEFKIAKNMKQNNVFHTNTIGKHINQVYKQMRRKSSPNYMLDAAKYHDIGKIYTKIYKNAKGEDTKNAHFYRHEKVSSYIYLINNLDFKFFYSNEKIIELYIQALIEKHMTDKIDCKKNKVLNSYFKEKYKLNFIDDLRLLNNCDKYRKWYQKIIIKVKKKLIGTK